MDIHQYKIMLVDDNHDLSEMIAGFCVRADMRIL